MSEEKKSNVFIPGNPREEQLKRRATMLSRYGIKPAQPKEEEEPVEVPDAEEIEEEVENVSSSEEENKDEEKEEESKDEDNSPKTE